MIATYRALYLHEETAMIGADTFVTTPFWIQKQDIPLTL
jgi:hypothetical protein